MVHEHSYHDAGLRLRAAVISYLAGYGGVDRILKDLRKRPANDSDQVWAELAKVLQHALVNNIPPHIPPHLKARLDELVATLQ